MAIKSHSLATAKVDLNLICLSIAIIASAIIGRLGMIAWPFLNDSGLYAEMGRTVAGGGVLYRDFYETKLPGAALLASSFWRAFGGHWAGYVVCQLLMAFFAAAALARSAGRHIESSAKLPVFLFAVVFLNLSQAVYTGFQLETIQAFFEALAAMAAIESLCNDDLLATFTAGLASGTAAMAKPGGIAIAVAFVLVLMFCRQPRRLIHSLVLFLGVAIPTAVTAIYTVKTGAGHDLPGVIRDIASYARGTPFGVDAFIKVALALSILSPPFAVRSFKFKWPLSKITLLLLLWFTLDFIAVLLQRRLYPYHFLPMACPAALLYGLIPSRAKTMSMAIGLLPVALLSLTWEGSSITKLGNDFNPMPVSVYVAAHTSGNDAVFTDQVGRLLIETNRQPGSRLGTFFYLVNDDDAPRRYSQILLNDFESRKPEYLVFAKGWDQQIPGLANCDILQHAPRRRDSFILAWGKLRQYVASRYHLEMMIDGSCLYRRNQT